jgi:hypothetical protein
MGPPRSLPYTSEGTPALLTDIIRSGQQQGDIPGELDATRAALVLWDAYLGVLQFARPGADVAARRPTLQPGVTFRHQMAERAHSLSLFAIRWRDVTVPARRRAARCVQ